MDLEGRVLRIDPPEGLLDLVTRSNAWNKNVRGRKIDRPPNAPSKNPRKQKKKRERRAREAEGGGGDSA